VATESLRMDAAFLAALQSEDDMGAVIRAHLHIEAALNEFLAASLLAPDELPNNMTYAHKLKFACALGLPKEHAPPLNAFGSLRNRFAHQLDFALTKTEVDQLIGCLSKGDRAAVEVAYRATNQEVLGAGGAALGSLPPRMQFAMVAITLKGMLMVAAHSTRAARQK
jgi:hypothetical protein